jgi:hypothetical protein
VATVLVDAENVRRSLWPNIAEDELEPLCERWAEANGHDVIVIWEGTESADDRIASEVRELEPPLWVVGGGTFARELVG